jgi:hypothetical protein
MSSYVDDIPVPGNIEDLAGREEDLSNLTNLLKDVDIALEQEMNDPGLDLDRFDEELDFEPEM